MDKSINWRRELRKAIEDGFDEEELQTLCFDLHIKYESLSGDNFSGKVRELIEFFERNKQLSKLIVYCKQKLTKVPWEEIEAAARDVDAGKAQGFAIDESPRPAQKLFTQQTIIIAGVVAVVAIIAIVAMFFASRSNRPEVSSQIATKVPERVVVASLETAVPTAETSEEPAPTATKIPPTPTRKPSPEPTLVPTEQPTNTPAAEPTAEPTDEPVVEPSVMAEPTVLYPDGARLELAYDANSFYLYNPSTTRIRVTPLTFEALDAAGRPLIFGLAGDRWTQFYSFIDGSACNGIEPFGVEGPYLRPQYCRSYNATITPTKNGDELFWIEREGVVEFRVLWNGEEVARCPLGTNTCELFVPAP